VKSDASRSLPHRSPVYAVANLLKQALVTHPGEIAARNPNFRQVARSDGSAFESECDRSIPQRGLGTSGQAYCLGAVPVTLADFRGFWRSVGSGD
jgi:hypothetical protein